MSSLLEQLGGSQFQARVGARNFDYPQGGLAFSVPNKKGANRVLIMPNGGDHYTITFFRFTHEVARVPNVYLRQLEATIQHHTTA